MGRASHVRHVKLHTRSHDQQKSPNRGKHGQAFLCLSSFSNCAELPPASLAATRVEKMHESLQRSLPMVGGFLALSIVHGMLHMSQHLAYRLVSGRARTSVRLGCDHGLTSRASNKVAAFLRLGFGSSPLRAGILLILLTQHCERCHHTVTIEQEEASPEMARPTAH